MLKIDMDLGIARFGGKRDRYIKSLIKFGERLPGEKHDYQSEDAIQSAHTVKGVAGNLGLTALFEEAAICEQALKSEPTAEAYEKFYTACAETGKAILAELAGGEPGAQQLPEGGAQEYAELKMELRMALELGNPSECDKVVAQMSKKHWPEEESLRKIYRLVSDYCYEEASEILNSIWR